MYGKSKSRNQKKTGGLRAQAMVEFAIALPVLMMLLIGIMEAGRMIFMYTSAVTASREAVRYASAYGRSDDGFLKYKYCYGIRDAAKKSGFFLQLQDADIKIEYDGGPGVTLPGGNPVCDAATGEDSGVDVDTGHRVTVEITATYKPIVTLLPFGERTFTATSSRTILGILELDN